jgi:prolipoprotein diacylglyceryltransferase
VTLPDFFVNEFFWGALGFLIAGGLMLRNLRTLGIAFPLTLLAATAGVYGGLWGSRVLAVLIYNPHLLLADPGFSMKFWLGTYSWLGGVLAGSALFSLVIRLRDERAWLAANAIVPGLPLMHAVIQIGSLLGDGAHGVVSSVPWAIYSDRIGAHVHPTQLYIIALELLMALLLQVLWGGDSSRKYLLPLYVLFQSALGLLLQSLLGAHAGPPLPFGLGSPQIVHFSVAAVALIALCWLRRSPMLLTAAAVTAALIPLAIAWRHITTGEDGIGKESGGYLVLTRSKFADALSGFVRYREGQGYRVTVRQWDAAPSPQELIDQILEHSSGKLRAVLLVGDCAAPGEGAVDWHLPSLRTPEGKLSDALYGDLDGDGRPDVPVGRLPVKNRRELRSLVNKLVMHERQPVRPTDFRLLMWTGAPGYEAPISAIIQRVYAEKPRWLDFFGICGSADSAFSGHIPDQPGIFLRELIRPSLVSMAVVHGSAQHIHAAVHEGRQIFLGLSDVARLDSITPLDPLLILACKSGVFDLPALEGDSLSEAFLKHPGGPVAVIAASGDDDPLTNYLALLSISDAFKDGSIATLGELLLHYQRQLHSLSAQDIAKLDRGLGGVERILASASEPRAREFASPEFIREGILRYNLLGDPVVPLRLPASMPVHVEPTANGLVASGKAPEGGARLLVDFVDQDQRLDAIPVSASKADRRDLLAKINRAPIVIASEELRGDTWEIEIEDLPACRSGDCYLRFRLVGKEGARYGLYELPGRMQGRGEERGTATTPRR